MIDLLIKRFVPDYDQVGSAHVRTGYGVFVGIVGIILNLLLFTAKLTAGLMTASVSIWADALNNLSDAGSSVVTLIGFRMADRPADAEHPFGHGRIEYVSGLIVSIIIVVMGIELGKSSFDKIMHPEAISFSYLSLVILVGSILLKLWMCYFNRQIARKIDSVAMQATSVDSLSDAVATSAVAVGVLVSHFWGLQVDGWIGMLVSLFIIYNGFRTALDSLSPLLGKAPDPAVVTELQETVLSYEQIIGIHDLIIHDYGPGHQLVSLHAEVSDQQDIMAIHDVIDRIESALFHRFGYDVTIHTDPVAVNDPELNAIKAQILELVQQIDCALTIHDFRLVRGTTHTNLIFDLVAPYRFRLSDTELVHLLRTEVRKLNKAYHAVIKVDHASLS